MKAVENVERFAAIIALTCAVVAGQEARALDLAAPTTHWKAIVYPSDLFPDLPGDQQTGSAEGDLVGDEKHAAFYTLFDDAGTPSTIDGMLAFRARVGADKKPEGYANALFVGLDANLDGALDLFLGVNNSGRNDEIGIWSPGKGSNTSPKTTTMVTPALVSYKQTAENYLWEPVTAESDPLAGLYDIDGGGATDHFLSFAIPFADLVEQLSVSGIKIDEATHLSYVLATATQANSLNQDLNGVKGGVDSSATWADLGVASSPITATGQLPEPSTALLALVGVAGLRILRRRRR